MNKNTLFRICALTLSVLPGIAWSSELGSGGYEPSWSYTEQDSWGEITDDGVTVKPPYPYAVCGVGRAQSPVNLADAAQVKLVNGLTILYRWAPLVVENNGHTIQVDSPSGKLFIGNDEYKLLQYHFHAPSEHVIGQTKFPMEIHFVHGAANGKAAVVGVLLKEGRDNPAFQSILDNAPETKYTTNTTGVSVNPRWLLPLRLNRFYTYAGSLTTPPCSEGINWYVLSDPVEASAAQIQQFQQLYSDNARHLQPLNERTVSRRSR